MRTVDRQSSPPPSAGRLLGATIAAAAVALVVLLVAVLPVEFGIDPIGLGKALGLMRPAATATADTPPIDLPPGRPLSPTPMGTSSYYAGPFSVDRAEFDLGPYDYVEYKYRLGAGATMQFAWEARAVVMHDFHGDRADGGGEVSYDKSERASASGAHTAPFDGMHGWYWENPGGGRVHITVTTAGFYSAAIEYRSNRARRVHELIPLRSLADALALTRKDVR
jgi:hypothetical protein